MNFLWETVGQKVGALDSELSGLGLRIVWDHYAVLLGKIVHSSLSQCLFTSTADLFEVQLTLQI